jgi:hypothetical protein
VRPRRQDDVHPPAGVRGTPTPQDDDALPAVEGEGLPAQALDVRPAQHDVAPGEQRVERRHAQFFGERVERLGGDHGHRGVAVGGPAGVAVTDDAVPRSDLELLAAVVDVQAGSAQDTGPTPSSSP